MKVLLLADPSSVHTVKWANSLSERGIKISLFGFSSYQKSVYNNEVAINSLNITPHKIARSNIYLYKSVYLISIFHIRRILKSFKPDIIHAHYASSYGFLGRIINFHPYFISVWGSDVFEFPKKSSITKRVFKYSLDGADKIFSTSRIMAEEISNYTDKKIELIPFGIKLNKFKHLSGYDRSEKTFVIGTVKALEESYGIEYLIKAFKIINDKYSQ
ncbi:MAG: glycosyltransferase, partial [Ignavibacteriaceae bacterium]